MAVPVLSISEIRNENWPDRPFFELLRSRAVGAALLQGCRMPSITEVHDRAAEPHEGPVAVRLHELDRGGMDEKTGGDGSRIFEPRDAELGTVTAMVRRMLKGRNDVFLNVNNHWESSTPLAIDRITALGLADGEAGNEDCRGGRDRRRGYQHARRAHPEAAGDPGCRDRHRGEPDQGIGHVGCP